MKTKTLLVAAAALAAATISSQAQVYSQNIVGYVNTVLTGNQYALVGNPLDNGTNNITSLYPSAPNGTIIQVWNGTGYQSAQKSFGNWNTNLLLAPGTGYFIKWNAAGSITNTFVGNLMVQSPSGNGGGTNVTALPNQYRLVSSVFPLAGNLTASGTNTLNLGPVLGNGSIIQVWNGSGYQSAQRSFGNWNTNLNLSVGQGYFVKPNASTNWTQILLP